MWVAQCSLAFEVLQDGFEDVLEVIFLTFLDKFSALGAPLLVMLGVWRVSGEAFGPHLESDSKKYEN